MLLYVTFVPLRYIANVPDVRPAATCAAAKTSRLLVILLLPFKFIVVIAIKRPKKLILPNGLTHSFPSMVCRDIQYPRLSILRFTTLPTNPII